MMKKKNFYGFAAIITAIMVIAIIGIGVTSCSGPEGPMGPEGPQGPAGSTGSGQDGSDGQDGADGRPATPVVVYTITYDSNGGNAIDPEKLMRGGKAIKPEHPSKEFTQEQIFTEGAGLYRTGAGSGWIFLGWFLNGELYDFDASVTADITLTAQWSMPGKISTGSPGIDAVPANADFFDKALTFVIGNPANYYLVIDQDYTAASAKTATATGITLTIVGIGSERTITANQTDGALFNINNTAVLNLGNNITLKGRTGTSTQPLIYITNGTLNMNDGSKITGYTTGANGIAAISVYGTSSRFNMDGGEISGNRSNYASGTGDAIVKIDRGRFTMNGGTITGNTVASNSGCILVGENTTNNAYFTMNGGTITGNTNTNTTVGTGGVYVTRYGNFTMTGGSITNNTATASVTNRDTKKGAGGVFIEDMNVSFLISGGNITGNTSPMGDVTFFPNRDFTVQLSGSAAIGTFTIGSHNNNNIGILQVGNGWTGTVEALNLYSENTNFATIATTFVDVSRKIIGPVSGYTLVPADIDKFKKFNFMNSNLVVQDISIQGRGINKSGTFIGNIQ
jgi:hypothetical protein